MHAQVPTGGLPPFSYGLGCSGSEGAASANPLAVPPRGNDADTVSVAVTAMHSHGPLHLP